MTPDYPDSEKQQKYISIWSKTVDTQMHFNDMSVKSRQFGLTFVVAVLGVAVVLFTRGNDFAFVFEIFDFTVQIHVSVLLFLCAWLALEAVKILDLNVYHKMLRGAVAFGEDFEEKYMKTIFDLEKGMTQSISHFTRHDDANTEKTKNGIYTYKGNSYITAKSKIEQFYRRARNSILGGALLLFVFTNIGYWGGLNDEGTNPQLPTIGNETPAQNNG